MQIFGAVAFAVLAVASVTDGTRLNYVANNVSKDASIMEVFKSFCAFGARSHTAATRSF